MCNIFFILELSTPESTCSEGELRLEDGDNVLEGRVEICINGAWGSICDNQFGMDEADVICRQIVQQMGTIHNGECGMLLQFHSSLINVILLCVSLAQCLNVIMLA